MILKAIEIKGHAVHRPPLIKGPNNDHWKQRMIAFFDACHIDMWDVVENGNYIPTNKEGLKIPRSSWNEEQKTRYILNSKVRNFLMSTLIEPEFEKVHNCKSSKEINKEGGLGQRNWQLKGPPTKVPKLGHNIQRKGQQSGCQGCNFTWTFDTTDDRNGLRSEVNHQDFPIWRCSIINVPRPQAKERKMGYLEHKIVGVGRIGKHQSIEHNSINNLYKINLTDLTNQNGRGTKNLVIWRWVMFLAHKDESFKVFSIFYKHIQNEKGINIASIRSDHGQEFENENFQQTPQQNGVMERKNKSLQEMARTMLNDFNSPKYFWAQGRQPNISYFHSFRCDCFILNTKDSLGTFIGYSIVSKAYRVYNSKTLEAEKSIHTTSKKPLLDDEPKIDKAETSSRN
ncbi:hypothetical protein CR513_39404, partial [Mucuna pruriens]